MIPEELQPLFHGASQALLGQMQNNPVDQYNAEHPLNVEGANPLQAYGASLIGGGGLPSGLDALTLQSILRQPGLAGAGPTTGVYNYGAESGLGDLSAFLNPRHAEFPGSVYSGDSGVGTFNSNPSHQDQPLDFSQLGNVMGPAGGGGGPGGGGYSPPGQEGNYSPLDQFAQRKAAAQSRPGGGSLNSSAMSSYLGGKSPEEYLKEAGINFSSGPSTGTTFSSGGSSYNNLGASHEGAGPGAESAWLQGLGKDPGSYAVNLGDKAYGGDLAKADKAMAAVAQGNLHDKVAGLTVADKQRMAKSGTDIFGGSAFGTKLPPKSAPPTAPPVYGDTGQPPTHNETKSGDGPLKNKRDPVTVKR